jgi:tetratricopeptide (TPR) repeat protein
LLLGEIYRDKHNFKEAEAEYRKAISLKPGELAAHLGLATTYYRAFKFDLAIPEIQKALEISPADPEANFLMGDILVYRHEYSEAMRYVRAALQGTPSSVPRVHALIGKIYASEGRLTDAVSELKQSLPGDRDGSFHFQLHRLYQKLGKEEAAAAALKESETIRKNALARQRSLLEISP